jgi:hypothetical protein
MQKGRRSRRLSLQVKVMLSRSAVGTDPSLSPPDPDWSLASVGVGVLAAVVEGAAPCQCAAAMPPCPPVVGEGRRG